MATAKICELTETNTCKLCENALGKYTCPRCNVLYCTLACYQSKNHLQCSETFYHDCVRETLANVDKPDETSQAKMSEILQRIHEENQDDLDSDDDVYLDLGDRLAGIDLDDPEKVWANLNSDERQEFEAFLRSGDASKLIPQWNPWWTYKCGKVVDVDELTKHKETCPKILNVIANFKDITNKPPLEIVTHNLANILASYAFTVRYFNGEHLDYKREAVACVAKLALTFKSSAKFDSFENAIDSVQNESINIEWLRFDEENIILMKQDVVNVLNGPHSTDSKFYILSALSDLHRLFTSSLTVGKKKASKGSFSKTFPESAFPDVQFEKRHRIRMHIKKVEYFLSYTKDILS